MHPPLFPSLELRNRQPEMMDQPGLDEQQHRQALRALQRVNFLSRSVHILWPAIRGATQNLPHRPIRILDVACGGGDVAVALWRLAARQRIDVEIEGCDISDTAIGHARDLARLKHADVRFCKVDVIAEPLPAEFDVITCSLFLHHLDESAAVEVMRKMSQRARHSVLINDLLRGRFAYQLAYWGCRLLSRSRIVHVDGPLSVAGAFNREEALALAERAGMTGSTMSAHWPQRFLLNWRRP